ncbi:hypothetical protein LPY66_11375 [Dehalobacter sp. DCM]|uniref:hypothetical protein n=1 Tax=Dehalobacter sp. DCM TaxID=2907827 RepID=UPI003081D3F8|nr:hypothetical protein LPY66_11375 [Dehalobacter sp. DCM]
MGRELELDLIYMGLSDATGKTGNRYIVGKFFDLAENDNIDCFIGDDKLRGELVLVKPMSPVTAFFKVRTYQGKVGLALSGVQAR